LAAVVLVGTATACMGTGVFVDSSVMPAVLAVRQQPRQPPIVRLRSLRD
jgi:hypothetical protein